MRIGNRIFPYPVLNSNTDLTNYLDCSKFYFEFETTSEGQVIVENGSIQFKGLHFILKNRELDDLYRKGKIKAAFVLECSSSAYRKSFPLGLEPKDLKIEACDLNGTVSASAYLYANCDIRKYSNREFNDIYRNYKFDLDKFDILAVDDGGNFRVNVDPTEDDKVSSIFTVVRDERDDEIVAVDCESRKIVIRLPRPYYEQYCKMKRMNDYNNISFAMLAVPALTSCLSEIRKSDFESLDDLIENYTWMDSVQKAYKHVTGKEFDLDILKKEQPFKIAQILLNHSSCKGIKSFGEMISGMMEESVEEYE